jgi:hypothetical protein
MLLKVIASLVFPQKSSGQRSKGGRGVKHVWVIPSGCFARSRLLTRA